MGSSVQQSKEPDYQVWPPLIVSPAQYIMLSPFIVDNRICSVTIEE